MTTELLVEQIVLAATQSCLLILLVLAIRAPVARWLGARWAYYLWLAPVLGLVGIMLPGQAIQSWFQLSPVAVPAVYSAYEAVNSSPTLVLSLWLLGFVIALSWFAVGNLRFLARSRRSSRELTYEERAIVRARCARLARHVEVDFRLLSSPAGPAIAGFFQPVLLLPSDFFDRYSSHQQALMLSHELEHLCRRDLLSLSLAQFYCSVFWFNPLAWIAERYMRLDQELSCDERVVSRENRSTRRRYGEALILATHSGACGAQANYPAPFSQLKKRTFFLRHHGRNAFASALGVVLLLSAMGGSLAFGVMGELQREYILRPELRIALVDSAALLERKDAHPEALANLPTRLSHHKAKFIDPPLSEYEITRITHQLAQAWYRLGRYDRAIDTYQGLIDKSPGFRDIQAMAFIGMAEAHFATGEYSESLKALVASEALDTITFTPETWAMRGLALTKLRLWDQALICLNRAIDGAEASGLRPDPMWLLAQTALRLNQGDLDGAVRSLEAAKKEFPEISFEDKLIVFNALLQDSWNPQSDQDLTAQF